MFYTNNVAMYNRCFITLNSTKESTHPKATGTKWNPWKLYEACERQKSPALA